MHGLKGVIVVAALVVTTIAISACRREAPVMGLGASEVPAQTQIVQ